MQILRKHIFVVLPLVLLATGSTFAAPQTGPDVPLLVETEWVEGNLGSSRLLLVDFGRSYQDYLGGRIPGAVFLDRKVVWDTVDGLNGMLPPEDSVVQAGETPQLLLEEGGARDGGEDGEEGKADLPAPHVVDEGLKVHRGPPGVHDERRAHL